MHAAKATPACLILLLATALTFPAVCPRVVRAGQYTEDVVSVAAIRKSDGGKTMQILFNEKDQINTVLEPRPEVMSTLEEAYQDGAPLSLTDDPVHARIISVAKPTKVEKELFDYLRKHELKCEKPLSLDSENGRLVKFNTVKNLKFPVWKQFKAVPDYETARRIFDYCAKQAYNSPGPHEIAPLIPFHFLRDGCYARAHKMSWIIENHFGYSCRKVFGFANENHDELSAIASRSGGCCVNWWYHVAPLIGVRQWIVSKGKKVPGVVAYVIDPSQFDKPALLSTWLRSLANPACSAESKISTFTIQPAAAYTPANYRGTTFTTDPAYVATNKVLLEYQGETTCR